MLDPKSAHVLCKIDSRLWLQEVNIKAIKRVGDYLENDRTEFNKKNISLTMFYFTKLDVVMYYNVTVRNPKHCLALKEQADYYGFKG